MTTEVTIIYRPGLIDDYLVEFAEVDLDKGLEEIILQAMMQSAFLELKFAEEAKELLDDGYDLIAIIRGHVEFVY